MNRCTELDGKSPQEDQSRRRTVRYLLSCLAGLLLISTVGCNWTPPLESAAAFTSTDALYTAITSHRMDLVDETETALKKLHQDGGLSSEAMESLDGIIATARREKWQEAAEELDTFIRNQPPHHHH